MKSTDLQHPGKYVRQNILPKGMTVKDAAKQLGIGRPALSSFLNGRSTLSPEMAIRLEKAFGVDRKLLQEMQSEYDGIASKDEERLVVVRAFVPSFLTIKANQIDHWAGSNIEARNHLPVLLRKLVHSTGHGLVQIDFPGYDNAQRKGNDGFVEATESTAWVPKGRSYWEFGTDRDPKVKANKDYSQRLHSIDASERSESIFVFVTPRNWPGKTDWLNEKSKACDWKAVRVLDASDLEQWLEQSVPAQIWLAELLNLPTAGCETLDQAWQKFAHVSEPYLSSQLFAPSIAAYRKSFQEWLEGPSIRPFVIAADSSIEAVAFLTCLFNEGTLSRFKDLAAVFTSAESLKSLISSSVPFIPIVCSKELERELGGAVNRLHCIVYRPRNAVESEPNVSLDLLDYDTFKKALTAMSIDENEIDRLARESGCSPTILRRRLSQNAAIQTPTWVEDDRTARTIISLALVGAWQTDTPADREIVSLIANRTYESIEEDIARLLVFDDCPVWSAGRHRGVASKIDALFAIAKLITQEDLDRFFEATRYVLSESDPALALPEEDRWAAALYGKSRKYSNALHEGICETLVILAVHGNNLFQRRLGIDVASRVSGFVRTLLTPTTIERLRSSDHDLPRFAEAAPEEFLNIIEDDLRKDQPVITELLKPVNPGSLFSSPARTGLLWALECLAWKPETLSRVSLILARLSRPRIDDNWMNKPDNSLKAIFRSWMPQTAASLDQRIKTLKTLIDKYPDVGWEICIEQIKSGSQLGHYSYRPRWRSDASGAGQVVTRGEMIDFLRAVVSIVISWKSYNAHNLGDIVECLGNLPEEDQDRVWDLIEDWSKTATEQSKAVLRERIRRVALTRRNRNGRVRESLLDRARDIFNNLRPSDTVTRHIWLFENDWLQESIEEIQEEDYDTQKHAEHVDCLRRDAMSEIWKERGFDGILRLLEQSAAAGTVGRYIASCITTVDEGIEFVRRCQTLESASTSKVEWCYQGFLCTLACEQRASILDILYHRISSGEFVRLLILTPFDSSTWRLLDNYDEKIRDMYWKQVYPSWNRHSPAELAELIDQLLAAGRPRAAFYTIRFECKNVETTRLRRLLFDVATIQTEPSDQFNIESYYISEALTSLDGRQGISREEMAQLEFLFIKALTYGPHGIPNLERQICDSPALFAQAVAMIYTRKDNGEDPPELQLQNSDQRTSAGIAAYHLLDKIRRIPGTDKDGRIDGSALIEWLRMARQLCAVYGRSDVGDQRLGHLLAKAPVGKNGIWPCEEVCEAMERFASAEMGEGFCIEVRNSRGIHCRGNGGAQEREIASKYRNWAEGVRYDYPFVGSVLEDIASSYDREAAWEDSQAQVDKRLQR